MSLHRRQPRLLSSVVLAALLLQIMTPVFAFAEDGGNLPGGGGAGWGNGGGRGPGGPGGGHDGGRGPGRPGGPGGGNGPGDPPGGGLGPGPGAPGNNPPANPDPTPTCPDVSGAYQAGYSAGQQQGGSEGANNGSQQGAQRGQSEGQQNGYSACEREARQQARDRGYHDGFNQAEGEGYNRGVYEGRAEGQRKGRDDGDADGTRRADNDAQSAATGPGRDQGYRDADASNAREKGRIDGDREGDDDALAEAIRVDYQAAREAVRQDKFAERVENQDSFFQKATANAPTPPANPAPRRNSFEAAAVDNNDLKAALGLSAVNINNEIMCESEDAARARGQQAGYQSAYQNAYNNAYRPAYDRAYRQAYQVGCSQARSRDYRDSYNDGFNDGRQEGYQRGYRRGYDQVYQSEYNSAFNYASQQAYSSHYDSYYRNYYDRARQAAYEERFHELYRGAFNQAHAASYARHYPVYAAQQQAKGRADELADFEARPIRILVAEVQETNSNGLVEPGEPLRIRFNLRNFAATAFAAKDVQLQVTGQNGQFNIGIGQENLVRDLNRKSVTLVSNALDLAALEAAVGSTTQLRVAVVLRGRSISDAAINVQAKYMANVSFAEAPQLREGIATAIRVKVKNQSNAPSSGAVRLELSSDPSLVEVVDTAQDAGVLAAGQEKVLEFRAIARRPGASINAPLTVTATLANGNRVGVLATRQEIPLVNDYRIQVSSPVAGLRNAGVTRVQYTISNVSRRADSRSLQLFSRVISNNSANFYFVGPNPQLLRPLRSGATESFFVPVNSRAANAGGVLELEVRENNRVVVISRVQF